MVRPRGSRPRRSNHRGVGLDGPATAEQGEEEEEAAKRIEKKIRRKAVFLHGRIVNTAFTPPPHTPSTRR